MRILILGAGGIGGYYGARLLETGADVTFLVRPARAALLTERGLVLKSPRGDAALAVKTETRDTLSHAFDLVVLSCKAYDLDAAISDVAPAVGPDTTVLPLLNGLAHLDRLDAAFGAARVIGGLSHIAVTLTKDGAIRHFAKLDRLTFGERDGSKSARCDAVADVMGRAAFETVYSEAILLEMWEKYVLITSLAALTGMMRAPIGAIVATRDGERLARQIIAECEAVSAVSGFVVREKSHDFAETLLTAQGSPMTASMLRDIEAGADIECEHLHGDMIRRGGAAGVATPLLAVAYCHLQAYRNQRAQATR